MFEKITLPNGVRIVYEHIPYVRSASAGIWVGCGSRFENAKENGASHFIEHMAFKGTKTRSAAELAEEMDAVGGQLNAFTTKECTCFYAQTLDTHLDIAVDVLGDMFFNSRFDEKDVNNERGVIIEEIGMYEDTPEDLVTERLFDAVFKGTPLGRRILGKPTTLKNMTGQSLKDFMLKHYTPENTVFALSGSFKDSQLDRICELFSSMNGGASQKAKNAMYTPSFTAKRKATEQNHICIAFPSPGIDDKDRYALQLISAILGRGMSSRLFQKIREQRGLCYSIYTFGALHTDIGLFGIYTALGSEMEQEALQLIMEEVCRFRDSGATPAELDRAREQSKANVLESTAARMNVLGRNELQLGRIPTTEEIIAGYDSVTLAQIQNVAENILNLDKISLSAVGRVRPTDEYRTLINEGDYN